MKKVFALILTALVILPLVSFGIPASAEDGIIDSLVLIEARENFRFRTDLANKTEGELSPITEDYYLSKYALDGHIKIIIILDYNQQIIYPSIILLEK